MSCSGTAVRDCAGALQQHGQQNGLQHGSGGTCGLQCAGASGNANVCVLATQRPRVSFRARSVESIKTHTQQACARGVLQSGPGVCCDVPHATMPLQAFAFAISDKTRRTSSLSTKKCLLRRSATKSSPRRGRFFLTTKPRASLNLTRARAMSPMEAHLYSVIRPLNRQIAPRSGSGHCGPTPRSQPHCGPTHLSSQPISVRRAKHRIAIGSFASTAAGRLVHSDHDGARCCRHHRTIRAMSPILRIASP